MENFAEYEDFVYLNTHLSKEDARKIARECWNKGLTKYEALEVARKNCHKGRGGK